MLMSVPRIMEAVNIFATTLLAVLSVDVKMGINWMRMDTIALVAI